MSAKNLLGALRVMSILKHIFVVGIEILFIFGKITRVFVSWAQLFKTNDILMSLNMTYKLMFLLKKGG